MEGSPVAVVATPGETLAMETAKRLYRRLDALFGTLKPRRFQPKLLESFLEECFASLRDDLRLSAGLLYGERRDGFSLIRMVGDLRGPVAEALDPSLPPLAEVIRHRVYIFGDPDGEGAPHRQGLLPHAAAAGLVVGQRPQRFAILFLLDGGWQMEELDFALNTIRVALDARLIDARVRGSFRERLHSGHDPQMFLRCCIEPRPLKRGGNLVGQGHHPLRVIRPKAFAIDTFYIKYPDQVLFMHDWNADRRTFVFRIREIIRVFLDIICDIRPARLSHIADNAAA